jgi:hypothetical protein
MRKIFLLTLSAVFLIVLGGCATTGGIISLGYGTINIKANLGSKPEKNVKVYVVEGTAVGGYEKAGSKLMRPKSVEYKGERRFLGTTPLTTTLTFRHYPLKGGYVWTPPQYAVFFIESSGAETSVVFGPWTLLWTDTATGERKETLYNPKEFPYDYFRKHPFVKNVNVPFNFFLEVEESDTNKK